MNSDGLEVLARGIGSDLFFESTNVHLDNAIDPWRLEIKAFRFNFASHSAIAEQDTAMTGVNSAPRSKTDNKDGCQDDKRADRTNNSFHFVLVLRTITMQEITMARARIMNSMT